MRCSAHTKKGKPCKGQAVTGVSVCRMHGGSARQVKRAATRNLTIARAQRMVELAGVDQDPIQHLLDSLHRAATLVNVWGIMVATLDDAGSEWAERSQELRGSLRYHEPSRSDAAQGDVLQVTTNEPLLGFSHSGEARIHPFVVQYEAALERRAKFAKMCLDAGVSERQVALAERMGEQLGMLFERTLAAVPDLPAEFRAALSEGYVRAVAELERPAIDGTARDVA